MLFRTLTKQDKKYFARDFVKSFAKSITSMLLGIVISIAAIVLLFMLVRWEYGLLVLGAFVVSAIFASIARSRAIHRQEEREYYRYQIERKREEIESLTNTIKTMSGETSDEVLRALGFDYFVELSAEDRAFHIKHKMIALEEYHSDLRRYEKHLAELE